MMTLLSCAGAVALCLQGAPASGRADADAPIPVRIDRAEVERYGMVEMTVEDRWRPANPYDDRQVAVQATMASPGGRTIAVPGFFCQEFETERGGGGREERWAYPVGAGVWKVRFAPTEVGRYRGAVSARTPAGTVVVGPVEFDCVPSAHRGFLRVSKTDPRYLERSDGTVFFPIGQNVAFIGLSQYVGSVERAAEVFRRIGENGGNYVRIWAGCDDWALGIEARKSCWGRSWNWRPPFAPMPDAQGDTSGAQCVRVGDRDGQTLTADPTRAIAVRPGTRYVLSGRVWTADGAALSVRVDGQADDEAVSPAARSWTAFRLEFAVGANQRFIRTIQFRVKGSGAVYLADLSLKETAGGAELLAFEADPNRPQLGWYDQRDCRLLDLLLAAAQHHGLHVQLCLLKRDLYMSRLSDDRSRAYDEAVADAKRLLRYAVARWGGYRSLGAWEYWNEMDPGKPTGRFFRELGDYLERIDPYAHPRTTSNWGPCPRDWHHPKLDLADLHYYLRPTTGAVFKDAAAATAAQVALLRSQSPAKPLILGEFGLADDKWGLSPFMVKDKDLLHLHDCLWASVFSGASSSALFWWWETLDRMDAYRHYRPLAAFLADVPFTTAGLEPAAWETAEPRLRVMALRGKARAYLWVSDPSATWHRAVVEGIRPALVSDAALDVAGLEPGTYRVEWWDTGTGRRGRQEDAAAEAGRLRLTIPDFSRDIAAKVILRSPL
jgi:hypothetical protein